jgi:hypothetical protein
MEDGIIPMFIAPDIDCYACGESKWGVCVVNTNETTDLANGIVYKHYFGLSPCVVCGMSIRWKIDPDGVYKPCEPDEEDPIVQD